jgi:DNA repair protein RadC
VTQTAFETIELVNIQMVRERTVFYNGNRVTAPHQAAEAFISIVGNPDREYFLAFMVDGKNRITSVSVISQGSLNQSVVHPRETFKAAVLANAASVIVAHNHPSGDLVPSREDIEITRRLKEAGDILGIKVLDHVIVNTDTRESASFVQQGLM